MLSFCQLDIISCLIIVTNMLFSFFPPITTQNKLTGTPLAKKAKTTAKSPESAIKAGHQGPMAPQKSATANQVIVQGHPNGIMCCWVHKHNKPKEEAFLKHDFDTILQSEEIRKQLQINEIVHIRGLDGATFMPQKTSETKYGFRMFLCMIGEGNNTKKGRRQIANRIISFLNANANEKNYKFPRPSEFGNDITSDPKRALDTALLNQDILRVIKLSYPDHDLQELTEFDDVIEMFFSDIEVGKAIMMSAHQTEE
jgi:hypothetical protein